MNNCSDYNNNNASSLTRSRLQNFLEQSKIVNIRQDELSHSSTNSHTLSIIRSIVDELYQINHQEILSKNESKEKRVRFTLEQEIDKTESVILNQLKLSKTSIKYQPMLSEALTVICCSTESRSKVDCSVSTHDHLSLQCDCATQTMDITVFPEYDHSLTAPLTDTNHPYRSRTNVTLSTTSISSRSTIIHLLPSLSIPNHLLYSCENNTIVPLLSTAHQLIIPSAAKHYDICHEQTLENDHTFITHNMMSCDSSTKLDEIPQLNDHNLSSKSDKHLSDKHITETDLKLCTCSKRKVSDHDYSMSKCAVSDQGRLLEELYLSKRSLQSMYHDGLFYIHDLVLVFLRNSPEFYQILVKHYYLSKKQASLYVKVMQQWWKKHKKTLVDTNEKLSKSSIIK